MVRRSRIGGEVETQTYNFDDPARKVVVRFRRCVWGKPAIMDLLATLGRRRVHCM